MAQVENQTLYKEVDIRKNKIKTLKDAGTNPYAPKFDQTHSISEARGCKQKTRVKTGGRIVARRIFGKFMFVQISDVYDKIQVSLNQNDIGEKKYKFFKEMVDIGDHVGFEGTIYKTQTGELTIKTEKYTLLSKAMLPLPEKFHGIADTEIRYRQRYLDIISNPEAKKIFVMRSRLISTIRNFLVDNGFLEVETPILQSVACGAAAKPFVTKHNALNKVYNLRISPETFLKQVVAGGIPRVFEIGKNFRNEGMDAQHLQEFTMLEWYASYWDYNKNIAFIQKLLKMLVKKMCGSYEIEYQGIKLDFGGKWAKVNYIEELNKVLGVDILAIDDVEELRKVVLDTNLFDRDEVNDLVSLGAIYDYVYKRKIRPNIIQPTIVYNYPNLVPLARPSDKNKKVIEMFQVLVAGSELVKAYSELVDPQIQRAGFEEQMRNKMKGDEEAFELDEDFLLAMEHGMPPMSGLGLGIDRLMCVLANQPTLRDVILFPNMK